MEGLTFAWAAGWPIVKAPIATDVKSAVGIAEKLLTEIDRRAGLYADTGKFPESLAEYHAVGGDRLPWIVAVFDEFTALAEAAGRHSYFTQNLMAQVAQRSRKFGMTLVLAGQDFKADLLPTRITNQLRTRVQFRCATRRQSEVVLGQGGAERLTVPGRALVRIDGAITELQTFWVDKSLVVGACGGAQHVAYTQPRPALSEGERQLAIFAVTNGKLINEDIERILSLSQHKARDLARSWEQRGWLQKGFRSTRRPTHQLVNLVEALQGRGQPDNLTSLTTLTA